MSSYLKRLQKHLMKFMYGSKTCVTIEYMGKEINEGGLEKKKKSWIHNKKKNTNSKHKKITVA